MIGPVIGPRDDPRFSPRFTPSGGKWSSAGFPTSAADIKTAFGTLGTWSHNWPCSEAAGNLLCTITGAALIPANSPTQGVAGAIAGDLAIDVSPDGSTERAVAVDATLLQHTTDGFALLGTFATTGTPAIARYFAGKIGTGFWGVQVNAAGHLIANINDTVGTFTSTVAVDHRGGAFHDFILIIDRAAQRLKLVSNLGEGAEVDITTCGSITSNGFFGIGRHASITGPVIVTNLAHSSATTGMLAGAAAAITSYRTYRGS